MDDWSKNRNIFILYHCDLFLYFDKRRKIFFLDGYFKTTTHTIILYYTLKKSRYKMDSNCNRKILPFLSYRSNTRYTRTTTGSTCKMLT